MAYHADVATLVFKKQLKECIVYKDQIIIKTGISQDILICMLL
jgi:hypothetical protein